MTIDIGRTEANKNVPFIIWLEEGLAGCLVNLAKWKKIMFLASCCDRLYGNYVLFHKETGWGDPSILCNGLRLLIESTHFINSEQLKNVLNAIETVTPNTEDFKSPYTSSALDAATAIVESLDYCIDDDLSHCIQVACLCRDSIYMFLQQRDGLGELESEEKIYTNPLMMKELQAQQSDIDSLELLLDDPIVRDSLTEKRLSSLSFWPVLAGGDTAKDMR